MIRLNNKPTFIDLFAGCGGLSLGLMEAGWQGLFAIEHCDDAFDTFRYNFIEGNSDSPHLSSLSWPEWLPRERVEISEFIKSYRNDLEKISGQVTLLVGGPPCQGFSFAGKRVAEDPRNKLFRDYIHLVDILKPKLVLIENVEGINVPHDRQKWLDNGRVEQERDSYSKQIKMLLEQHEYAVSQDTLIAAEYGVPQLRPRYFTVGIRKDLENRDSLNIFKIIRGLREGFLTSHGLPINRPVNVMEAISDLLIFGNGLINYEEPDSQKGFKQIQYHRPHSDYQKLMHGSINGAIMDSMRIPKHKDETIRKFQVILKKCRKGVTLSSKERLKLDIPGSSIVPLSEDKPSHTLTTLPDDLLHYMEPRIHTVREHARLQSFPDWFKFRGKYTTGGARRVAECPRYTQVGNAVPPLLAEAVGLGLIELLQYLDQE